MSILTKILGDSNERFVKKLNPLIAHINKLEKDFEKLTPEELKRKTEEFKKRINEGETLDGILTDAFSAVREAAKRTLKQRHFDVQLLGGVVLHQGKIAEMRTGEGKTLVATLPVYLNALKGLGAHVVTVNDYLSRRDAVWMGQIYHFLGLSVGCLNHESSFIYDPLHIVQKNGQENGISNKIQNSKLDETRDVLGSFKVVHEFLRPCTRKEAYAADITYGTNNEYGFDYLRDNMAYSETDVVQRGHYFAIVDEIDSILIDEARTPLIISAPDEESAELYKIFSRIVPQLKKNDHYTVEEKYKTVSINEEGIEKIEKALGISDIYTEKGIKYVHHLEQALRAHVFFRRDRDYVVKNGEVIIVDEFTGRLMPGRRWSEGLHQAIEAQEGATIQRESRTLASVSFQNYFRMYEKLAGMTGTALTSAEEFSKVYNLDVVVMPTNRPMVRKDWSDLVYQTEVGKFKAVAEEIKKRHQNGQPVLVGTVSIEKNEHLSAMLKREGVPHKLLNAKHHEEEGEIIAQAGRAGTITVATNMAGRGVDIVLGGNPLNPEQSQKVREAGGLCVIGTERHEARRIDDQLRGRSGRQGDPGESRFYVSLEDDLMRVFGSDRIKSMMGSFGIPEDQPIENSLVSRAIESAQAKIEGMNFDTRKHLLEYDDVMNKQRTKIYSLRRRALLASEEEMRKIVEEIFLEDESGKKQLEEKLEKEDKANFLKMQKVLFLRIIDMLWIDHLEMMDYMRSSVNLRAYGQRDPLVEYKNEGVRMFRELEAAVKATFVRMSLSAQAASPGQAETPTQTVRRPIDKNSKGKIGRNDPCWCGATRPDGRPVKYKHCHGKNI